MDRAMLMYHIGALEDAVRLARTPMVDSFRGREALLQAAEALIAAVDDDTTTVDQADAYLRSVGIDPETIRRNQ